MWTRSQLKDRAKSSIKQNYWLCLGVTFVYLILTSASTSYEIGTQKTTVNIGIGVNPWISLEVIATMFIVIFILGIIVRLFFSNVLEVGYNRFYLENREEPSSFGALFSTFTRAGYLNVVKTLFLRDIYIFLWTLLLIIPGIVKAYEYYMIPMILAENPTLETSRVFELTRNMTDSQKFDIFVLDLSFILWHILGFFTLGLVNLLVSPYITATSSELYSTTREYTLDSNFATYDELPGFSREAL